MTTFSPKSFDQVEAALNWAKSKGYENADQAIEEFRRNLGSYSKVARAAVVLNHSQRTIYDLLKKRNGKEILALRLKDADREDLASLFISEAE